MPIIARSSAVDIKSQRQADFNQTLISNDKRYEITSEDIKRGYVEGEVLVKFQENKIDLNSSLDDKKIQVFYQDKAVRGESIIKEENLALLKSDNKTTENLINELRKDTAVEYVEPNYIRHYEGVPNDTDFNKLWGLHNSGQNVNGVTGTNDADIDAPEAWDIQTDSNSLTVAVIDSGIAPNHPDLSSNLVAGWDFVDNDSTTDDMVGHGTHVAGIIGAVGNNSQGITGLNWNVKIMPLKVGDLEGVTTARFISALDFAVDNGIKIVNYSVGGYSYSSLEYWAIESARNNGVLLIAAAGNEANNNDGTHHYPSDYDLDNIISVAATDQDDNLAEFSNYGTTSVDVTAPGKNIYSTVPYNAFFETFENATKPGFTGTNFTSSGSNNYWETWGTSNINAWGNHNLYPYEANSNGILTSSAVDSSAQSIVILQYDYQIEAENSFLCLNDYLSTEVYDGSIWHEVAYYCGKRGDIESINISVYKNADLKVRFKWVTNSSDNNYSGTYIDNIKILYPNSTSGGYEYMDGTSMATPYVTGLAALIKSYKPSYSYKAIKENIINNVDKKDSLSGKVLSGGRINAYNSLLNVDITPPTAIFTYSKTDQTNGNVIATLVPSEPVNITNNSGLNTRTFTENGSFTFEFEDAAGNVGSATATVSNIDKVRPIITFSGSTPVNITQGEAYADAGATASDNFDGDITSRIVVVNPVNTSVAGSYTITYNVTDSAGNTAEQVVRIVNVNAPPAPPPPPPPAPTAPAPVVSTPPISTPTSPVLIPKVLGEEVIVPVITSLKLSKGEYKYKLNGKIISIKPFGTSYKGKVWAKKVNFGTELGVVYLFINSEKLKTGAVKMYSTQGKLIGTFKPYGGFATNGLNADITIINNEVYLAVGTTKAGTTARIYKVTNKTLKSINTVKASKSNGNVIVAYLKLYSGQYGLVTMLKNQKSTIKVWKYDSIKNKFIEDTKFNKKKIKVVNGIPKL